MSPWEWCFQGDVQCQFHHTTFSHILTVALATQRKPFPQPDAVTTKFHIIVSQTNPALNSKLHSFFLVFLFCFVFSFTCNRNTCIHPTLKKLLELFKHAIITQISTCFCGGADGDCQELLIILNKVKQPDLLIIRLRGSDIKQTVRLIM